MELNENNNLTDDEAKCLQMTEELWNALMNLPVEHQNDSGEFCRDIHDIQNRIMSRPVRRSWSV